MTKKLNVLEDENLKVRNCTKGNNGRVRVKKNSSFLEKLNTYKEKLKSHNKSI